MIKTFTQDDVVRYVYQETSELETKEIRKALLCDAKLEEMYKQILSMKADLDKARKNPSDHAIDNILNYSKSFNVSSSR
ncbi:MAG: hypothetical protein AAF519_19360 [Bacteroidota bacterium]